MRFCFIVFLVFGISFSVFAQSGQTVEELLKSARLEKSEQKLASALRYYLQAVNKLEKQNNKKALFQVYTEIGIIYQNGGLHDKAIEYFIKSQEVIDANSSSQAAVSMRLGESYLAQKDYPQTIAAYQNAKQIYQPQQKPYATIQALRQLITAYQANKDYQTALEANKEILEVDRSIGDSAAVAATLNNIGYVHKFLGNYSKAITSFDQARKIERKLGLEEDPITLTNVAIVYQNLTQYDNALRFLKEATKIVENKKEPKELARLYNITAAIYYQLGDYHNAREYNELALEYAKKYKQREITKDIHLTASQINQANNNYEDALKSYEKHLNIRDSLLLEERLKQQELLQQQFLIERTEKELQLYMVDEELKTAQLKEQELTLEKQNQELALLQQKQELQAERLEKEGLEKQRTKQELLIAQQQLNAEKARREVEDLQQKELNRQREVESLEQQADLNKQTLARERAEAEKKQAQAQAQANAKEAEREAQQKIVMIAAGLTLLILLVIGFAFLNSRKKNKELAQQKDQIESKNVELEQQTEEIQMQRDAVAHKSEQVNELYKKVTDSVRYAQRIQDAILVPPAQVFTNFGNKTEGFVLFKPRDIVSGDFYWTTEKNNKVILTAADCTGHGVPGAFMSLIGNDLLNEIVNFRGITAPHEILNELHAGVQNTLKQKETENRDGMDMALCVYDKEKNILEFAGAKNPLLYIQNGEIKVIKGDKKPIGGKDFYEEDSFTTHSIDLNEENAPKMFYIFSDGYQDQFGGIEGRKFMIKKLRGLLQEIHQKPMEQQHQILDETIIDWMKNEEQIDDILLMGFRIG
ncbi:tetratricopeptide repeat protein [Bernardetia litoralis DSM 6794]|uniref:Tetratricopeptide repeat protein n=1 Tax=Bernardetia litoralis (strain ATCC 23117 / DSM 6794 / NBRC 15988 / NCIMB 1366 / Fx l1 / Sio-4) TaxID=880071 RepID=I4ANH5_BERLS|nr:tetratricopeptide repeat protein [Bernardetia litoralis]AFM05510.1 tetratricopeptide repeat protein [Bernardetia litoralis DSM 6794]